MEQKYLVSRRNLFGFFGLAGTFGGLFGAVVWAFDIHPAWGLATAAITAWLLSGLATQVTKRESGQLTPVELNRMADITREVLRPGDILIITAPEDMHGKAVNDAVASIRAALDKAIPNVGTVILFDGMKLAAAIEREKANE